MLELITRCSQLVLRSFLDMLLISLGLSLYVLGLAGLVIRLNRRSPRVLMYHAIEDTESDFTRALSINTTPAQFASHLEFLSRHYRIVGLKHILENETREPTVTITFDDGFRSVYEHAWPRLRKLGLTATCYLTSDVVGNESLIWLNELNWFLHRHAQLARPIIKAGLGLTRECSDRAMIRALIERFEPEMVRGILTRLRATVDVEPRTLARRHRIHLDWDQVAEMSSAGITFGNHTASHPPLANLDAESCRQQIRRASAALAHLPGAGSTLAYPFGSRTEDTREVALELGLGSLLEVEGLNSPFDPTRIGRIKVASCSPAVLFAKMEIVEPAKAWLKRWLGAGKPRGTPPANGY